MSSGHLFFLHFWWTRRNLCLGCLLWRCVPEPVTTFDRSQVPPWFPSRPPGAWTQRCVSLDRPALFFCQAVYFNTGFWFGTFALGAHLLLFDHRCGHACNCIAELLCNYQYHPGADALRVLP